MRPSCWRPQIAALAPACCQFGLVRALCRFNRPIRRAGCQPVGRYKENEHEHTSRYFRVQRDIISSIYEETRFFNSKSIFPQQGYEEGESEAEMHHVRMRMAALEAR